MQKGESNGGMEVAGQREREKERERGREDIIRRE